LPFLSLLLPQHLKQFLTYRKHSNICYKKGWSNWIINIYLGNSDKCFNRCWQLINCAFCWKSIILKFIWKRIPQIRKVCCHELITLLVIYYVPLANFLFNNSYMKFIRKINIFTFIMLIRRLFNRVILFFKKPLRWIALGWLSFLPLCLTFLNFDSKWVYCLNLTPDVLLLNPGFLKRIFFIHDILHVSVQVQCMILDAWG